MGILDELKKIFIPEGKKASNSSGENVDNSKNTSLLRNIIIIGMIGTLFLLFGNVFMNTGSNEKQPAISPVQEVSKRNDEIEYAEKLCRELEEIVSLVRGVGKVRAKIYINRYIEYEYEYNSNQTNKTTNETDQNGGQREIVEDTRENEMVVVTDSMGNEKPVIRKMILPEIKGVLIVAQGAENSKVKYEIIKAVSSLLDIPIYRINVLPYERG